MSELPVIRKARQHQGDIALHTRRGPVGYQDLVDRSATVAMALLQAADDLAEQRVAVLVPPGYHYITALWGVWRAGGVFLPLSLTAAEPELEYALTDAGVSCLVTTNDRVPQVRDMCDRIGIRLIAVERIQTTVARPLPDVDPRRRAMILYTSGTTSKPKGVVSTHENIEAMITSLVEAWRWEASDCIPLFLPLHHIHGIINVLSCALWTGATIEPYEGFDAGAVFDRVAAHDYTVFMAVPTIYVKMIDAMNAMKPDRRAAVARGFAGMRLMISGSAALPARVHEQWSELTGQQLLERYGMTEIGMALSNPYDGERRPGYVGVPLPGVQVRLVAEDESVVEKEGVPGEIRVSGPMVFTEYWGRPEITAESFRDGWFRTGDMAVVENGYYRILGRSSVDIIKSGGYKLSALEIETALLDHPAIRECAVVGIPDETWGEAVAAAVVLKEGASLTLEVLRTWCRDRMSSYKLPKHLLLVDALPRNAMGKVTKPAVAKLFAQ